MKFKQYQTGSVAHARTAESAIKAGIANSDRPNYGPLVKREGSNVYVPNPVRMVAETYVSTVKRQNKGYAIERV